MPFLMAWPGTFSAGMVFTNPVSALDFTPTFLAAAGRLATRGDNFDGVNLLPGLRAETATPLNRELMWRFTISAAIREGDWKLVRLPDRLPSIFNLNSNPAGQHDVAMENLDRTRAMLQRLGNCDKKQTGLSCRQKLRLARIYKHEASASLNG